MQINKKEHTVPANYRKLPVIVDYLQAVIAIDKILDLMAKNIRTGEREKLKNHVDRLKDAFPPCEMCRPGSSELEYVRVHTAYKYCPHCGRGINI